MRESEILEKLTPLYESGRTFQFIQLAHGVLREIPRFPKLATLTLRALIDLELGGPARELVQLRKDLGDVSGETAVLIERLSSLPNGRVQWEDRRDVLQRNLEAVGRNSPKTADALSSIESSLADVQLFRTCRGDYQASRRRRAGALRQWLQPITADLDVPEIDLPPQDQLGVPAIVGVCTGVVLDRLYRETKTLYLSYSHPIYLFEPDTARFAAWLHTADHTELLADQRVYVFIGKDAVAAFRTMLAGDPHLPIPTLHIGQGADAASGRKVKEAAEQAFADRERELRELARQIDDRYRGRSLCYWKERFDQPGTALGITSRFTTMLQYSMRDAFDALERTGFKTTTLTEPSDHHQFSPLALCREILDLDPDFVLSLDHLRYEHTYMPTSFPLLTWIQDPMDCLLCERAGASIGPLDFVCGFYRDRCIQEFSYPANRFVYTDIPVSTRVFHDEPVDATHLAPYSCDISFVSNASTPIQAWFTSSRSNYPAALHPMLDYLYANMDTLERSGGERQPAVVAVELVKETARRFSIELNDAQSATIGVNFLYRLYDWGRRQETLEWVGAWAKRTGKRFKLYGRGWENHPTLGEFAAGPIEHGEPLRRAYTASTLGLQLIPSGFRHQRTYELVASGSLPITRYCDVDFAGTHPTSEQFPQLRDIVFRDAVEFESLAERLLGDGEKRSALRAGLHEVVMQRYTYDAVMEKVLGAWREYLDRASR